MRARIVAILTLLLTAALFTTTACAASPSASPARTAESAASAPRAAAPPAPAPAAAPAAARAAGGAANQPADQFQQNLPSLDRMIIRTVTMTIAVPNVQEAYNKVEALVSAQRGYLSGTRIRQEGDRTVADVTLRVPADPATYQATLEQLRALADRVMDEQSQAQDVTEEYVDLESRMRNLQATEQSLLALLQKATKVEDIINVQRELTNVRGQIEQIQGRKQALERRADMATITLTIRESATFARPGWSAGSTFERAVNALGSALRVLAEFGIYALVFAPIWGGMALLLWAFIMGIRWLSRRTAQNRPLRPPFGPDGGRGPASPAGPVAAPTDGAPVSGSPSSAPSGPTAPRGGSPA